MVRGAGTVSGGRGGGSSRGAGVAHGRHRHNRNSYGGGGGGGAHGRHGWIGPQNLTELTNKLTPLKRPVKRRLDESKSYGAYTELCRKHKVFLQPIENSNYVFGEEKQVNSLFEEPSLKHLPNTSESAGSDVLVESGPAKNDRVSVECFIPSIATAVVNFVSKLDLYRVQQKKDRIKVTLRGTRTELIQKYKKIQDKLRVIFITGVNLLSKSRLVSKDVDVCMERLLTRYLKDVKGPEECPPENIKALGECCYASVTLQDEENLQTKYHIIDEIQKMVRKEGGPQFKKATIHMFGSSVSGLAEQTSDLDIACDVYNTGSVVPEVDEAKVVNYLGNIFRRRYRFRGFQAIPHARCPIIKNEPQAAVFNQFIPLDSPFDLSFRLFGVYNSRLLRAYFVNPDLRVAAVGIKAWSKSIGINNPRIGYLSSYAITLLFIHYCLRKKFVEFTDPDAFKKGININDPLPPLLPVPVNDPEFCFRVGTLIAGFFKYFGAPEFDYEHEVVTIRQATPLTKKKLDWIEECYAENVHRCRNIQNIHLAILDPYEKLDPDNKDNLNDPLGLNVCRGLQRLKFMYIRGAFRTAWREVCRLSSYPLVKCIEIAGNEEFFKRETPRSSNSTVSHVSSRPETDSADDNHFLPHESDILNGISASDSDSGSDEEVVAQPHQLLY